MSESSVPLSWCPVHGLGAKEQRTSPFAKLSWWECPHCIGATAPAADSRDTEAPRRHHAPHAKRYAMRFQDDCWGMDEMPDGSYVRFDDYEALRRQYDATADYYRDGLSYKGTERCLRCGFWKGCGCLCAPQEMSDTAASVPEDHDGK